MKMIILITGLFSFLSLTLNGSVSEAKTPSITCNVISQFEDYDDEHQSFNLTNIHDGVLKGSSLDKKISATYNESKPNQILIVASEECIGWNGCEIMTEVAFQNKSSTLSAKLGSVYYKSITCIKN